MFVAAFFLIASKWKQSDDGCIKKMWHVHTMQYYSAIKIHALNHYSEVLVAQMVKDLPAVQETWVQSLDQEDPLKKRMATLPSNFT